MMYPPTLVSQRTLAKGYRVARRTVADALASALPPPRKPTGPRLTVLDQATGWIDAKLAEDVKAPRKQRSTIRRIVERVHDKHGLDGALYTTVKNYVTRRCQQVGRAAGRRAVLAGRVPQLHEPGAEADVDFCNVWVRLGDRPAPVRCGLLSPRMCYSRKCLHRVFASESQQALMDSHVEALRVLGGVPTRHIEFDRGCGPSRARACG